MINKTFYFIVLILCFFSCKKENKSTSQSLEKSKQNKIDLLANRYLQLNRFSGTICITREGNSIYNASFGLADYENKIPFSPKTAFKIGDLTKIVATNIVNGLVKEGKIRLADSISRYLKEIESDITVDSLMNNKTTTNYNILGQLVEKVSQKSYQENIDKYSADLGLENTYFKKTESSIAIGYLYHNYRGKGLEIQKAPSFDSEKAFSSKGLKSTANDLMKIIKSNPRDLNIDGYIDDDGFSYSLTNDTKNKLSIIVLSNRRHPVAKEISNSIKAILSDKEYKLPLPRTPFDIDKSILKDYTGSYKINENVSFDVENSNDSLFVLMGGNKTHLIPQSSNQFYMEQVDASMRFLRDPSNIVNRIVLLNGFIDSEEIARRIK